MKLAIVITGMSFGGAERVTAYLSNYFVEQNVNVTIISLTKTVPAYSLSEDIRYIWYDASGHKSAIVRDFSLMRSIRKTISELKPDLVMGMMSYSGTLAAYACIGLPVPVLLSERNDPNTSIAFKEIEKH
jgi:UDP-N-acetylglucosamine:LPS N-acetylglucosamine transferase